MFKKVFLMVMLLAVAQDSCAMTMQAIKDTVKQTPRWAKVVIGGALTAAVGSLAFYRYRTPRGGGAPVVPALHPFRAGRGGLPALLPRGPYQRGEIIRTAPGFTVLLNRDNDTPLHEAVRANDTRGVRQLLADGHSPYVRNLYGETPVSIARVRNAHANPAFRPAPAIPGLLESAVKEYEDNRAWLRTVAHETVAPQSSIPLVNSLIAEFVCGPNDQALIVV